MTTLHTISSLDYGDGRTCVCRICVCGKHRCTDPKLPFFGETTYRDEYVPKSTVRDIGRARPSTVFPMKADPGHFKTTKQEAWEPLEGKIVRPAESFKPRTVLGEPLPFNATTTHRNDFPGHLPDHQRARYKQEPLPKLKGTYETTNQAMQEPLNKHLEAGEMPKPPQPFRGDATLLRSLPFDAMATYTVDYPPKEALQQPRPPQKQPFESMPDVRDFGTTHSESYKVPPHRVRRVCPASQLAPRPPSVDGHYKLSVYAIPSGEIAD
ncbi:hypothetical protein, conserved [Trypanosoma brucei gambiense DAL972]|uniref:STOP axonemal protein n=2 Tax=Trypanosoma brucei TaxID=5691 RepID=C9ZWA3_TRYB9|nr:hypothetical protein, conserved [Trypanosoma brucei gambiense DAL972]RHW72925.1 STOP axonemal protein [Trypanosoma brucei equiperdum]CBH13692.1 hypothetical protein, conserved [Trypanosoma brucei gambiense DAL972]|eukprot:XP_011775968.1 hypothetical protein, conserved [Trypanosoma brucei gambiense DAL972]